MTDMLLKTVDAHQCKQCNKYVHHLCICVGGQWLCQRVKPLPDMIKPDFWQVKAVKRMYNVSTCWGTA